MRLRIRQSRPSSLQEALRVAVELDPFQQASRQQPRAVRGLKMEESPQQTQGISETDKSPSNRPPWVDDLLKAFNRCLEEGGANPQSRLPGATGRRQCTVCWKCHQSDHIQWDCKHGDGEPANPANPAAIPFTHAVIPQPASSSPGSNSAQAPSVPLNVTSVYKEVQA